jgi:hypothetical protein
MKLVSSANNTVFAGRAVQLGRSFIYRRNKRGLKIDPCGTPYFAVDQVDVYFVSVVELYISTL